MKKALAILLAAAMIVPASALAACAGGADGKDGKDGVNGINGINGIDGVNGTDGKSAYELYIESNPSYTGSEEQWLKDLAAGKLVSEHSYSLISYGKLVNGNVLSGTATNGASELNLSSCVVGLDEPIIMPVYEGAEWEIRLGGTLATGSSGVQLLTTSHDVAEGRIFFAVNASKNIAYIGVNIDGYYLNYCWDVPAATINGKHEYSVRFKDGVYGLSIDGGDYAPFTSYNYNQTGIVHNLSANAASAELTAKIKAVTGQEYFSFTSMGAESFKCSGKIGYAEIKTSAIYGYEELSAHPLYGKTVYHLGSSISYGYANGGKSFAEQIARLTGSTAVKETMSGTTLSSQEGNSYVQRFAGFTFDDNPEFLVLQLSTNDFTKANITLGSVGTETDSQKINTQSTAGAIDYIAAETKYQSPETKIIVYTCGVKPNWGFKAQYSGFINSQLKMLQSKWDNLVVVDLFNAEKVYTGWMSDDIHPTGQEYANLFTPNLINKMVEILKNK